MNFKNILEIDTSNNYRGWKFNGIFKSLRKSKSNNTQLNDKPAFFENSSKQLHRVENYMIDSSPIPNNA